MARKFIRWKATEARMYVSVCLGCRQFVCAAPDEAKVNKAEATHRCGRAERSRKVSPAAVTASGVKSRVRSQSLTEEADGAVASD